MKSLLGSALGVVNEAILETAINYQLGYGATITELWWNHVVWNLSTSFTGTAPRPSMKKVIAPGWRRSLKRQSSSVQAPNGILPVEKGRMHRGTTEIQRFSRRKKYEDLTHKDGRLEILQKWKFVSPKIRICHWLIYVRRLLNIKLCEMVHPQLHEDITRYGTHYCRWKSGRQNWIQPSKIRWKLTRFWATRGPKIWKSIGRIISSVW